MAIIHVPRPPASAYDPNRKASDLLLAQVEHMHIAERRLPERYRSQVYVNAIETEGEVADYIGRVTQAVARAHQDARKNRTRSRLRPGIVLKIAASAQTKAETTERNRGAAGSAAKARKKKSSSKSK